MSQHITTLVQELYKLRAHCPQAVSELDSATRFHLYSKCQVQTTGNSLAVVLFELLQHLENLARK